MSRRALVFALCLLTLPTIVWAQASCQRSKTRITPINTAVPMGDLIIGSTPVTVMDPNQSRCSAIIANTSAADIRCSAVLQAAPTATTGKLVGAGKQLILTSSAGEAWRCVRVGGVDATVEITEEIP